MGERTLCFNGIDGATGRYALPPMTAEELVARVRWGPAPEGGGRALRALLARLRRRRRPRRKPRSRPMWDPACDPRSAGWGVVFAAAEPRLVALREALAPLLELRRGPLRRGAGRWIFREFHGPDGYQAGESAHDFLSRHGVGPGPADVARVPYYLLIVGDPETIPWSFQYQLDVRYAVGRLHFDTLAEYARYAAGVVAAETASLDRPRRVAVFAPQNADDVQTATTAESLASPLARGLAGRPDCVVESAIGRDATKARLAHLLGGGEAPDLLFTAGHGLLFASGDPRQRAAQGALICQDWPGPRAWPGTLPAEHFFAAADLADDAAPRGLFAFHFACCSAGTPTHDDFSHLEEPDRMAPEPFLSPLARRLLAHPRGGALAVVGHVDRAWGCAIEWPGAGRQIQPFEDCLAHLLAGCPVGWAMESFGERYAELATVVAAELAAMHHGRSSDAVTLAMFWTACHDARNYAVLGDPAVRLPAVASLGRESGA